MEGNFLDTPAPPAGSQEYPVRVDRGLQLLALARGMASILR